MKIIYLLSYKINKSTKCIVCFSCQFFEKNVMSFLIEAAGPGETIVFLSDFGLALSSLLMILGRLEFFTVLALLVPSFWKRNY
jgi:hypothetical protein